MILYIHGFASSGQGTKAQMVRDYFGAQAYAPSLPYIPDLALDTLTQIVSTHRHSGPIHLIGSSLGGFYATILAERFDLKAVLVNPSTEPWKTLSKTGYITHYYDLSTFEWTPRHVQSLAAMAPPSITVPQNYRLMLQTGDDVLDYRIAMHRYKGAETIIEEGGSHAFEGFENHLPAIAAFFENR